MNKIELSLMNKFFDLGPSNLKPGVADEKVIDIWTRYAAMYGEKDVLSAQEIDKMIEDNLENGFIKSLFPKFSDSIPGYKKGVKLENMEALVKRYVGNLELSDLTLAEALPACKKAMKLSVKRSEWHKEWGDRLYIKKNLPEKYRGNEGYELFMKEKTAEFEKNYKS